MRIFIIKGLEFPFFLLNRGLCRKIVGTSLTIVGHKGALENQTLGNTLSNRIILSAQARIASRQAKEAVQRKTNIYS